MIKGLFTSASAMLPRAIEQEMIANNLANLNTAGYKRDRLLFRSLIDHEDMVSRIGQGTPGALQEAMIDFSTGPLKPTSRNLDLALAGEGFFAVQAANGIRYTRNGNFAINPEGQLVTANGETVLGEGGAITLTNHGDVHIDRDGTIFQLGNRIDKVRVVNFASDQSLRKVGASLFETKDPNAGQVDAPSAQVMQGYLEESNVNPVEEMVNMILALRIFEANQRGIAAQDRSLDRLVNETGKL
jgi:flagellar basal-body rod protein FlgG